MTTNDTIEFRLLRRTFFDYIDVQPYTRQAFVKAMVRDLHRAAELPVPDQAKP